MHGGILSVNSSAKANFELRGGTECKIYIIILIYYAFCLCILLAVSHLDSPKSRVDVVTNTFWAVNYMTSFKFSLQLPVLKNLRPYRVTFIGGDSVETRDLFNM